MGDRQLADYILASDAGADPQPVAGARVYRRIVRANLETVIANALPVTKRVLGAEGFGELLAEFFAAGGPVTSFYREIPGDFVFWAAEAEKPLADLIQWEWLELLAARHPADLDSLPLLGSDAVKTVRPNPTIQAGVFTRAVHLIDEDHPQPEPFEAPLALLVWRKPRTDETASRAMGLLLARAFAIAMTTEPAPALETLVEQLASEAPALDRGELRAALEAECEALREEEGLVGA